MDLSSLLVRRAEERDLAALRELRLEALRSHPESFGADYESSLAQPVEFWRDRLLPRPDGTAVFIADAGHTLAGMCGILPGSSPKTRHVAMIWGMYVRPEWRRRRLSEALLAACIDAARTAGMIRVRLAVVATNEAAIRCYRQSGFETYGVEPDAIRVGEDLFDELLMTRRVAPSSQSGNNPLPGS
jgi:GNAT superfamily N-acetyltransferase